MENTTSFKEFYILAFSTISQKKPVIFVVFLFLYNIGVFWNLLIILAILKDSHLHTPMYLFLCNLSLVDICYPSVTLPKLMHILLTGMNSISVMCCFAQMFFFIFMGGTEIMLLSSMAYDRYIAICDPLHYNTVMDRNKCGILLGVTWISGFGNAAFIILLASKLQFCRSNKIHQFFCDVKALSTISCSGIGFQMLIFIEAILYGFFPFLLSLLSYIKIISVILKIRSVEGRKKAFSTCSSHLSVIMLYYATILCMYMRSPSEYSDAMDHIFSVLYSSVTPMLNPLIYSLRNKDVKNAMKQMWTVSKQ
ncbi:olfactory receptor 5V1-like [Pelobates fuscus]|uniref:olfactory receptor 5V1-like n=1 Tax=Pelobates fuscus TaxID=191477 RepID=UPI002FE46E96